MGALADGGVTMKDVGVLAAGNLMGASAAIGQMVQKQVGQTGIPVYNVANACATGATALRTVIMALKAGECDVGPGRRRREARRRRPARRRRLPGGGRRHLDAGAVATARWRRSTAGSAPRPCPGVFAQIGMEYGHRYGGVDFELFAKIAEKNHAHSTLNPLASYQKRFTLEEIMNDVMIAYPNTRPDVLGQLRRRGGGRGRHATPSARRCRSSSSAARSRSAPRCSPPTRGRRPARSCPT